MPVGELLAITAFILVSCGIAVLFFYLYSTLSDILVVRGSELGGHSLQSISLVSQMTPGKVEVQFNFSSPYTFNFSRVEKMICTGSKKGDELTYDCFSFPRLRYFYLGETNELVLKIEKTGDSLDIMEQ